MALNISGASLTLAGTPLSLESVYARLSVIMPPKGIMLVELSTYHSRAAYSDGAPPISIIEIPPGTSEKELKSGDQLLQAHLAIKSDLEKQGYTVSITDL